MSKSTGKLKSLTLEEKMKLIELVEDGKSVRDVAEEYGINKNTLHYILKHRDKIRDGLCLKPNVLGRKRIKDAKFPELEQRVIDFMEQSRRKKQKLSGNIIKAVALEIAAEADAVNFAASNGWLFSFFKRNSITISEFNKGLDPYSQDKLSNMQPTENFSEASIQNIEEKIEYDEESDINVEHLENVEYAFPSENEYSEETFEAEKVSENQIADEQFEMEDKPMESPWRNWCRMCGCIDSTIELDLQSEPHFKQLLNFSSDIIRICEECNLSMSELSRTVLKGRLVESMIQEIEDREKIANLTADDLSEVRKGFGFDLVLESVEDEPFDTRVYCIEEEEHLPEQDESEEVIYEEIATEDLELAHEEQIEMDYSEDSTVHFKAIKKDPKMLKRSPSLEDSFVYKCHICNETFKKMFSLTNHTRTSHSCMPKVACSCGRFLSTWDSLMAHKRKHSPQEKCFVCDLCNESFRTKTGLAIHIKFKHEKPKEAFSCPTCGRIFKEGNTLKNHIRTHLPHAEKYSFECEICGKKVVNKFSLKYHISTIHEKTIQHFCHVCGRGFGNKSNLRSHLISHSTENVSCEICGGTFKNRISLQSHKKVHKPEHLRKFACEMCNKKFHNANHLKRHLISHSEERQFKCPYEFCTNEYKWQKDLNNHVVGVHSGEKPHKCVFCDRSFVDAANLRKHKVKDHPEDLEAFESEFGKGRQTRKNFESGIKYENQ